MTKERIIGKRRDGPEIDIKLELRGDLARALINAAKARKIDASELLADIIEMVLTDDLIAAVCDV